MSARCDFVVCVRYLARPSRRKPRPPFYDPEPLKSIGHPDDSYFNDAGFQAAAAANHGGGAGALGGAAANRNVKLPTHAMMYDLCVAQELRTEELLRQYARQQHEVGNSAPLEFVMRQRPLGDFVRSVWATKEAGAAPPKSLWQQFA